MVVKTASGSQYVFTDKGNKTYVMKGLMEGIVESVEGLKLGSRLTINFYKCNPYTYKPQKVITTIITSPITEIAC